MIFLKKELDLSVMYFVLNVCVNEGKELVKAAEYGGRY